MNVPKYFLHYSLMLGMYITVHLLSSTHANVKNINRLAPQKKPKIFHDKMRNLFYFFPRSHCIHKDVVPSSERYV